MLIAVILIVVAAGFFLGMFDDVEVRREPLKHELNPHDDIQFDPWTDEWYGEGPWWKKW